MRMNKEILFIKKIVDKSCHISLAFFVLLCIAIGFLFITGTGCRRNTAVDVKVKKIVVILSGSTDDMSWNKANVEGIEACNREKKVKIEYLENVKEKDYERVFVEYAAKGYDLIIGAGSQFNDS